jgi:hypothetical protein
VWHGGEVEGVMSMLVEKLMDWIEANEIPQCDLIKFHARDIDTHCIINEMEWKQKGKKVKIVELIFSDGSQFQYSIG